jgi:predicted small lipoprotein YifL
MKVPFKLAAAAAVLVSLAACGDERGPDGLTSEEREKLNTIAEKQDAEVIDASPDSLVANDEWIAAETAEDPAAADNAAPAANGTANAQ